ncbi:MAG: aldo/keto reductase [Acidimicrobiales bacterium]|nr:aldo/keto reductase [Acidimicrobiales bacterium]MBO0886077.1 aldo/keto reductase [Acidimicrobiales bacterium]
MAITTHTLGRTGATVTSLGYGAMELRGGPRARDIADADAGKLLNSVLDGGITFVDTSIDYGKSEELIGAHISHRRDQFFLASKCGCPVEPPPPGAQPPFPHNFSAANVRAGVEQSLRRLRTDHLDLVQVHASPSREQMEADGTVEELVALRDEGKVRFLGMSGTLPNLPDHIAMGVFDAFQIPYSALQREHEDLITQAARSGAGTIIRGGVARGAPSDEKGWRGPLGLGEGEAQRRWEEAGLDELLQGMDRMTFMLRFTLSHPDLSTTIVGTSSPDHLRANLEAAAAGPLPADVYAEAKRRLAAAGSVPASAE